MSKSFVALITPLTIDPGAKPDHTLPGDLPIPTHPIVLPLPPDAPVPPGIWGGSGEPMPTPPIQLPPDSGGWLPIFIWGGGNVPMPTPPIELPPPGEVPEGPIDWKAAWTPATGWIVVGVPTVPHPAPSKKK